MDASSTGILIIGASAAGVSAAGEARKADPAVKVTVVTEESHIPYYRPLLTRRIADEAVEKIPSFLMNREEWYHENRIELVLNERIVSLDLDSKTALAEKGRVFSFDRLVLATGARPFVPMEGALGRENVFAVRALDDAREVSRCLDKAERVAVIGGGVLGIEAADAVVGTGRQAFIIEMAERILPLQLDEGGSKLLESVLREKGCRLMLGDSLDSLAGERKIEGVRLKSGGEIPVDAVIFSVGVRPRTELAVSGGIAVARGVLVNERMETSIPGVYACGDAAEFGKLNGLWMPAVRQGKVVGRNAAGGEAVFANEDYPATLNAFGVTVFSIGDLGRKEPVERYSVLEHSPSGGSVYKKLFFLDGVLSGGLFIGDNRKSQSLLKALREGLRMDLAADLLE
jgi:NAD(P)H-nitrite reductase large subunit